MLHYMEGTLTYNATYNLSVLDKIPQIHILYIILANMTRKFGGGVCSGEAYVFFNTHFTSWQRTCDDLAKNIDNILIKQTLLNAKWKRRLQNHNAYFYEKLGQ